jgi:hypothetical protein
VKLLARFGGKGVDPVPPIRGFHASRSPVAGLSASHDVAVFPPVLLGVGGTGARSRKREMKLALHLHEDDLGRVALDVEKPTVGVDLFPGGVARLGIGCFLGTRVHCECGQNCKKQNAQCAHGNLPVVD